MVFWEAEVVHDTHAHTHGKSYHHKPHCGIWALSEDVWLRKGWKYRNELNLHWDGGSLAFLAIFCAVLPGVSNWASEIGKIATSQNKVKEKNKNKKTVLFFLLYMNREKANWEQMRGPEGVVFMSFHVCTDHITSLFAHQYVVYVSGLALIQWQLFSLSYIVVLVKMLWLRSLSCVPIADGNISWWTTAANGNLFSIFKDEVTPRHWHQKKGGRNWEHVIFWGY